MLDLSSLKKALDGLKEVLAMEETPVVRDNAIQRFEYTYELGVKMLRRYLEMTEPTTIEIDEASFRDLIRIGWERGCIRDPQPWFAYREARNTTSHAYDEKKAEAIYAELSNFSDDAAFLFEALSNRILRES